MKLKHLSFLLPLLFLAIQLSFSQNDIQALPIILVENKTYFLGEEIRAEAWLGFSNSTPLPNQTVKLDIVSENLVLSLIGETNETGFFSLALPINQTGIYNLTFKSFIDSEEIQNSSFLLVEKQDFKIFLEKEDFEINETVSFLISGPKNESFIFLVESEFSNQSFLLSTDENGTCLLNLSFEIPANYTAKIENFSVSFKILPKEEEVFLNISLPEEVKVNESAQILVFGTATTSFNLKIFFEENLIYHLVSSTNEEGKSQLEFTPAEIGIYTLKLTYGDEELTKNFTAIASENVSENITSEFFEFKIILPRKEFFVGENVSFEILGKNNSILLLKLLGKEEKEFEIQLDEYGSASISFELKDSGEYKIELFFEDSKVAEETFFVLEKVEISFLSLQQGEAKFWEEVEWNASIFFKNRLNETKLVNLSSLLPEAEILGEEKEFLLSPLEEKILNLSFKTPAPFIQEIESKRENFLLKKKFLLSSNCSLNYSNVYLSLELPDFKEVKVFLDGIELLQYSYNLAKLNGSLLLEMEIPSLKENFLEIIGSSESKEDAEIFLENVENEVIECEKSLVGRKIYGILISSCKNITIKNCEISGYKIGVFVKNSEHITLADNILKENKHGAVFLNSKGIYLLNNTAEENFGYGVLFFSTFEIHSEGNKILNNFDKEFLNELKLLS